MYDEGTDKSLSHPSFLHIHLVIWEMGAAIETYMEIEYTGQKPLYSSESPQSSYLV